jgi:hypothetical protein
LIKHCHGEFLALKWPALKSLLGRERELIRCYNPPLCNDSPCARLRPPEARSVRNVAKAKKYWRKLNSS